MPTRLNYIMWLALSFAPTGLARASDDGVQALRHAGLRPLTHVICLAFSLDGSKVAVVSVDDFILTTTGSALDLWNLSTNSVSRLTLSGSPSSVVFIPDEDSVLVGFGASSGVNPSIAGRIEFWDLTRKTKLRTWMTTPGVNSLAISPDARWIAYGGSQGRAFLLDAASGAAIQRFEHSPCPLGACNSITNIGFLSDGRAMFTVCQSFRLWSIERSHEIREEAGSDCGTNISSVAFSKGDSLIALAEFGSPNVTLVDRTTGPRFRRIWSGGSGPSGEIVGLAFIDSRTLCAVCRNKGGGLVAFLYDVASGVEQATLAVESAGPVAFSSSGCRMATGDSRGFCLIDLKRKQKGARGQESSAEKGG